jgi:hypothetical protein
MKLKNKLALDSVENCGPYSTACEKWFLKGFEAAREMMAESMSSFTIKIGWEGKLMTESYYTPGESKELSLSEIILTLGEKEVE